jgi:hypothetical protein
LKGVTRQQPWCAYALYLATISPPAIIGDGILIFLLSKATQDWEVQSQWHARGALLFWMFISKFVKLLGHFIRYPKDVVLLPVSILFGYFYGFIKVYALFSLNVVRLLRSVLVIYTMLIKMTTLDYVGHPRRSR